MRFDQDVWTDPEVKMLRTLWAAGLSASDISSHLYEILRVPRTRNAVIGKARRLQLSARKSPIIADPNSRRGLRRDANYQRLLTHPNEDLLRWSTDEE